MVVVKSTTKGLAAMTLAVANARGWLDYDAPVARYWPEFAQNGKDAITVRQLLGHEAGLVLLDEKLTIEKLRDLDDVARVLARQKPAWPPGTRHGYHAMTIGLYMQELIRRVDPAHRTLGRFFHEEIAAPLGLEFYIGLPREIPDERLAQVKTFLPGARSGAAATPPAVYVMRILWPGSLLRRSMLFADVDSTTGATSRWRCRRATAWARRARSRGPIRRSPRAERSSGSRRRRSRASRRHRSRAVEGRGPGRAELLSLGFLRPGPELVFGSSPRAFGAPGAGGSFGFADPDARLGYAYVMNKLDFTCSTTRARRRCATPCTGRSASSRPEGSTRISVLVPGSSSLPSS